MPPEQPGEVIGGVQLVHLSQEEYTGFLELAKRKGSQLESIRMHLKLKDLKHMSREQYTSVLKVLESK